MCFGRVRMMRKPGVICASKIITGVCGRGYVETAARNALGSTNNPARAQAQRYIESRAPLVLKWIGAHNFDHIVPTATLPVIEDVNGRANNVQGKKMTTRRKYAAIALAVL